MLCYIYILLQFLILVYVTFLVPRRRLNSQQTAVSYHKSIAVEKVHHNTTLKDSHFTHVAASFRNQLSLNNFNFVHVYKVRNDVQNEAMFNLSGWLKMPCKSCDRFCNLELASLKKEEENRFWLFGDFWVHYLCDGYSCHQEPCW